MKIVVFGLSISSAWGNGHATLLRGLFRALHAGGHQVHFFERDVPYYSSHRDSSYFPYVTLHLYTEWKHVVPIALHELASADVGMVTSYCADGASACSLVLNSHLSRTIFYDMDTPVTLTRLEQGEAVPYLPAGGLRDFDLVLSYTGGQALDQLQQKLSARRVAALYGWVDPDVYYPVQPVPLFESNCSYLGTYSQDRQAALETLFLSAARELSSHQFAVGGAMYPSPRNWPANVKHFEHVTPPDHAAFYSSSPLTLNVTRSSMAAMGYCPSGRLFEAAACGTVVLSDWWEGLDSFFTPDEEILICESTSDSIRVLDVDAGQLAKIAARARERTLDCHTANHRAKTLIDLIEQTVAPGSNKIASMAQAV